MRISCKWVTFISAATATRCEWSDNQVKRYADSWHISYYEWNISEVLFMPVIYLDGSFFLFFPIFFEDWLETLLHFSRRVNSQWWNVSIFSFFFVRSAPSALSVNSNCSTISSDQLTPICELEELSNVHTLGSTSKTSLKLHRANNTNVVEIEDNPRRTNDVSLGECQTTGAHPTSSSYSSSSMLNQQPLNLPLPNNTNSSSGSNDSLLSTTTLSSITNVKQHRTINNLNVTEAETVQRCTNDASPGECQASGGLRSSSSFYLSPTLNLSSSSSSSSSDSGVSLFSLSHALDGFIENLRRNLPSSVFIIGIKWTWYLHGWVWSQWAQHHTFGSDQWWKWCRWWNDVRYAKLNVYAKREYSKRKGDRLYNDNRKAN